MSEPSWEPEAKVEVEEEAKPELESQVQVADTSALTLSVDDFSALEERILRTVDLVKRERETRAAAEQRIEMTDAQLLDQMQLVENLEKEQKALRIERDQIRQRVERMLEQLDALDL